jgi:DNA (cytosine-5)-methyltransferase 1
MAGDIRVIDLFAGCGGITQGLKDADVGFRPVAAVEIDRHAAATYAVNHGDHVYVGDIADWVQGSLPAADVVVGGPPCQGFSALGKQDATDPRNQLWRHYVDTLETVRPAFFVLENVPQFLKAPEFEALHRETRGRGRLGMYELEPYLLNAADFGAAQRRRRAVVIGRRRGTRPLDLEPGQSSPKNLRQVVPYWMDEPVTGTELPESTVPFQGSAVPGAFKLRDLHITRQPTDLSLTRYRHIPPGGNRTHLPDHLKAPCWLKHKSGAGDVMGRLVWTKPSVTIRTEFFKPEKGRYLHPDQHRPITHAEAAVIQGFGDGFLWCGTKVSIARQIGNAVPPPLAQGIARKLAERFL